jgi:large subunit ribosomal protein L19
MKGGKKAEAFKGFKRPKGEPDDLKLIKGVTPELEAKLNKLGLIKFEQIANLTDDEIAYVDEQLSLNGAIEHDDWVGKATDLMAETTVDEVPVEEEEGEEASTKGDAAPKAKAEKPAKAKESKKPKKG